MNQGTPQGSHLSPILWCAFFSRTLRAVDRAVSISNWGVHLRGLRRSLRNHPPTLTPVPKVQVCIFSYVDDVNPLVISQGLIQREHDKVMTKVEEIMEAEAATELLKCDGAKDPKVNFGRRPLTKCTTLRLRIQSDLTWEEHIHLRAHKARAILVILCSISNHHSGISPKDGRALYTGCIRLILTYSSEVWHQGRNENMIARMAKVQYQALRKAIEPTRAAPAGKWTTSPTWNTYATSSLTCKKPGLRDH